MVPTPEKSVDTAKFEKIEKLKKLQDAVKKLVALKSWRDQRKKDATFTACPWVAISFSCIYDTLHMHRMSQWTNHMWSYYGLGIWFRYLNCISICCAIPRF